MFPRVSALVVYLQGMGIVGLHTGSLASSAHKNLCVNTLRFRVVTNHPLMLTTLIAWLQNYEAIFY